MRSVFFFFNKPSESWAQVFVFVFEIKFFQDDIIQFWFEFYGSGNLVHLEGFVNVSMVTILASGAKIMNHADTSSRRYRH